MHVTAYNILLTHLCLRCPINVTFANSADPDQTGPSSLVDKSADL